MFGIIPKRIKEEWDTISLAQIFSWTGQMILIFIKPRKFFINYQKQGYVQQIFQIIYYFLLHVGLVATFQVEPQKSDYLAFSLLVLSTLLFVLLTFAHLLVSRKSYDGWYLFSYILIVRIVFSFPAIFFLSLFLKTEIYTYYFYSALFNATALIYVCFVFWGVKFTSFKKIVIGSVTTILLVNILNIAVSLLVIDETKGIGSSDPILAEIEDVSYQVLDLPGIPFKRIDSFDAKNVKTEFLLYKDEPQHRLLKVINGVNDFDIQVKLKLVFIDSFISKAKYNRTKHFLKEMSSYFRLMHNNVLIPPSNEQLDFRHAYISDVDSQLLCTIESYSIDTSFRKNRTVVQQELNELAHKNEMAEMPYIITGFLIYPSRLILRLFDVEKRAGISIVL